MNIDGKALSAQIRAELKEKVALFKDTYGFAPGLAVILVGADPASQVYVRNKHRACEELGMTSFEYTLPENTKEEELVELLKNSMQTIQFTAYWYSCRFLNILMKKESSKRFSPKKTSMPFILKMLAL